MKPRQKASPSSSSTGDVRTIDQVLVDLDRTEQLVNEFFCESEDYTIDAVKCEVPVDFKLTIVIPV